MQGAAHLITSPPMHANSTPLSSPSPSSPSLPHPRLSCRHASPPHGTTTFPLLPTYSLRLLFSSLSPPPPSGCGREGPSGAQAARVRGGRGGLPRDADRAEAASHPHLRCLRLSTSCCPLLPSPALLCHPLPISPSPPSSCPSPFPSVSSFRLVLSTLLPYPTLFSTPLNSTPLHSFHSTHSTPPISTPLYSAPLRPAPLPLPPLPHY